MTTGARPPPSPPSPFLTVAAAATAPPPTGEDVLLDVRDVWQKLGGNQILEGVTLQVKDRVRPGQVTGQVVALLGPSGVGKTRLIRLISGLDRPDRGQISGVRSRPLPAGSVGVVFQSYPLLRHHTVLGNMMVAGIANGLPREEAQDQGADAAQAVRPRSPRRLLPRQDLGRPAPARRDRPAADAAEAAAADGRTVLAASTPPRSTT